MNVITETAFKSPALIKPRNPRIARQLATCGPGLGHMYCGSLVRGLWIMTATYLPVGLATLGLCLNRVNWTFFAGSLALSFMIQLWSIWDAIHCARQTRMDYRLKDYNRLSAYVMLFLVPNLCVAVGLAVAIVVMVGGILFCPFDIPGLGVKKGDYFLSSKLAYGAKSPAKNDRVIFRFTPTSRPITPGLILAVAGESIPTSTGTTIVPPDQVWLRFQDRAGKNNDWLVSNYAIGGKIVFRFWPFSRFGEIPMGTPN